MLLLVQPTPCLLLVIQPLHHSYHVTACMIMTQCMPMLSDHTAVAGTVCSSVCANQAHEQTGNALCKSAQQAVYTLHAHTTSSNTWHAAWAALLTPWASASLCSLIWRTCFSLFSSSSSLQRQIYVAAQNWPCLLHLESPQTVHMLINSMALSIGGPCTSKRVILSWFSYY